MYDVESLRRRIGKEGVEVTISDLKSTKFDTFQMKQLEASLIFVDGILNVPFIRSLSNMKQNLAYTMARTEP